MDAVKNPLPFFLSSTVPTNYSNLFDGVSFQATGSGGLGWRTVANASSVQGLNAASTSIMDATFDPPVNVPYGPTEMSDYDDNDEDGPSSAAKLTLLTTFIIVGTLTVVMNVFVLAVVWRYEWMRTNTNIIIASMAVTDLIAGLSVLAAGLFKWGAFFAVSDVFCYVYAVCDVTVAHASLLHVLAVNAERYLAIIKPLYYKRVFKKRLLYIYIAVIWVVSLGLACMYVFNMRFTGPCLYDVPRNAVWTLTALLLTFPLPLLIIIGIYIHIVVVTLKHLKFLKNHSANKINNRSKHAKMAKSVGVIFAAYLLCWGPTFSILIVVNVTTLLGVELQLSKFVTVFYFVEVLSYANSLINPVIYFISSRSFQRAARQMFAMKDISLSSVQSQSATTPPTAATPVTPVTSVTPATSVFNLNDEVTKL